MTQYNNAPTMGKFSWKTTGTGNTANSGPTHNGNHNRAPRKRREEEIAGGDELLTVASGDGVDNGRDLKIGRLLTNGKGSGLVGTEARNTEHTDNVRGVVVEEGEASEESSSVNGGKLAMGGSSPVRRSTRIHTRSEEDLVSTDEGSSQGLTISSKASAHIPALPVTSSPAPGETKRVRIHTNSMHQCGVCGKMYKHRNCLTKHAWEHHESWALTKKWCQTKHQQVQMLEAAQVLTELTLLGGAESTAGSVAGSEASSGKTSRKGAVSSF